MSNFIHIDWLGNSIFNKYLNYEYSEFNYIQLLESGAYDIF